MGAAMSALAVPLGAVAGAFGKPVSQEQKSGVDAGQSTAFEDYGQNLWNQNIRDLTGMVDSGPGQSDIANATSSQRDLASMLQQFSQSGGLPTSQDISSSNSMASNLFAGQRQALSNSFLDQGVQAARQAGIQGRAVSDPILQAKLAQSQTLQQGQLMANQSSFAQQLAMQQPFQRLGFAQQRAGVLSGLATQAMNNRQQLAAMGEGIMNNQQNWRLQTANRWGNMSGSSGGGVGGAFTGALAGLGIAMGSGGFGGGGGSQQQQPLQQLSPMSTPSPGYMQYQSVPQGQSNIFGVSSGSQYAPDPFR